MSDPKPFAFSQFVPGFDFLKSLATGGGSGTGSALPGLSSWVAPTLSVEEVDKRIQELKTVQFWLEQNGHALKATIQALEVQKMTLSTLRGMNVRMEDIASAFTRAAAPVAEPPAAASPSFFKSSAPAPAPEPEIEEKEEEAAPAVTKPARKAAKAAADGAPTGSGGVVDPMQWWGSLTQQFQQIADSALQDASQLKMPAVAQPLADVVKSVISGAKLAARAPVKTPTKKAAPARKAVAAKRPVAKKAPAKKSSSAVRKR